MGLQTSNKSIDNEAGNTVGYIAEEERSFLATISRQAFATHRPFRAVIMDVSGSPVLWVSDNEYLRCHEFIVHTGPPTICLDQFQNVCAETTTPS